MDDVSTNDQQNTNLPFDFRRLPVSDSLQEENWKAVEAAIRQRKETPVFHTRSIRPAVLVRLFAAAACLAAVAFGLWFIGTRTGHTEIAEIRTGYGEIKNVILPDSSVVILNANSMIRIPQGWTEKAGREVWLDGEAYFKVQKKPAASQKFTVHTREVDVEVLGTKFNVTARRQRSVVALEEGKVRLTVHGNVSSILEKKTPLVMRPGQVAVAEADRLVATNNEKQVAVSSGWTRHEFHFDSTTLGEIARLIEDNYGYKMEVEDSSMLRVRISGDLRVTNIEELIRVLELPSGYAMRIKEKTIYVTTH